MHRHIGIALLGCSFVLFMLWALPYAGGVDAFHLATSKDKQLALAPEHMQLESKIRSLHLQYAAKEGDAGIAQLEGGILETVDQLFADENPDGELLRGDAAYLAAVYAAVLGRPCAAEVRVCARAAAAAIPSFQAARELSVSSEKKVFDDTPNSAWYSVYVQMLTTLGVIDANLDAVAEHAFGAEKAAMAADVERWMARVETGKNPTTSKVTPGATITKKQGVQILKANIERFFAMKAARR